MADYLMWLFLPYLLLTYLSVVGTVLWFYLRGTDALIEWLFRQIRRCQ